jgi:plasmid stabilization system protein ParE
VTARLIVRPSAERDIDEALTWYFDNAPEHAYRFLDDLQSAFDRLSHSPRISRTIYGDVRRAALRTFPYLIWFMYFEDPEVISILAVSHQRQDPDAIQYRLP